MKKLLLLLYLTIVSVSSFSQNNKINQNSGLRFLDNFSDNSKVKNLEKKENQTSKILFNIRRYIVSNQDYYKDYISQYGLEDLYLDAKKTILKYKYLEVEIKGLKEYEDIMWSSITSDYSAKYYTLLKTYNNVSSDEIVYELIIKFFPSQKHINSRYFILDSELNVLRGGGLYRVY